MFLELIKCKKVFCECSRAQKHKDIKFIKLSSKTLHFLLRYSEIQLYSNNIICFFNNNTTYDTPLFLGVTNFIKVFYEL